MSLLSENNILFSCNNCKRYFSSIVSPPCATWHARLSEYRQTSLSKKEGGKKWSIGKWVEAFYFLLHPSYFDHYCISGERRSIGSYGRDCMVSPPFSLYYFIYELGKAVLAKLPVYSVHACSGVIELWGPRENGDLFGKLGPLMFSVLRVLSLEQDSW